MTPNLSHAVPIAGDHLAHAASETDDYETVKSVLAYVSDHWRDQPSLEEIAAIAGMEPTRLHKTFKRWAGITPKEFLQAITIDHARRLLEQSATVLDTAYEVGLSGPGRLHDLFVSHEAVTPGDVRTRGAGLTIVYGFHPSPFGQALVMATERGLCGLGFADPGEETHALADMMGRWPRAQYVAEPGATAKLAARIFDPGAWHPERPLKLVFIGSDFEIRVWETLLRIPLGGATTYSDIAAHLDKPKGARAVGGAVGRNPLSFVVPCHRVLGRSGSLTGYHWGLTRKRAILGWEAALAPGVSL